MKPYYELAIVPRLIAETVCAEPYTGAEISDRAVAVADVEALRQQMTAEQVAAFANFTEARCLAAYEGHAEWFMKCARSRSNRGRDQLYNFVRHWLAAYLLNDWRLEFADELLALGFKPKPFRYGQATYGFWRDGLDLVKGRLSFSFTEPAEVHYIRQLCEAAA